MDCASEESEIRRLLDPVGGIRGLQFNLANRELIIEADAQTVQRAIGLVQAVGFPTEAIESAPATVGPDPAPTGRVWGRLVGALALALAAEGLFFWYPGERTAMLIGMALAAGAIALSGFSVYAKGFASLRAGRLNISALMAVAVTGAFLIGQWPEAAMVMALYSIAEVIEARAYDRARSAIKGLLAITPAAADMRQPDGSWSRFPVEGIPIGAIVRIRPGERIPLDGVVIVGSSAIDQSPVTGESLPVDRSPGDEVYAGTINQTAALEVRVTAFASDSTLARIILAVEQAQASRAPTQRFVDRFAAVYTPAVFVFAVAVAALTPWLLGWTWTDAVYKALVLLVIACPCALVIATPVTIVSGLAAAARRGVLIKGGVYLEEARRIRAFALDKTGTITAGKPQLVSFEPLAQTADRSTLEMLARSLSDRSDHPISQAIARAFRTEVREVVEFEAQAGRGIQGTIDGRRVILANHRWIEERGQCTPEIERHLEAHEQAGRSVSLLADDQSVLAICAVADTIKPGSREAIAELQHLGVAPVMLSGDNPLTARTIGAQAGVTEVHGNLLPAQKLDAIAELQKRMGVTAMAGDGINDAPALAKADIGFAMGAAGTHIAIEAADVVVMNDDLRRLPETIRLARRTYAVLWQNITLALAIKLVFLILTVFGQATMWMAVFADMGASLIVVMNGLRLLNGISTARVRA